MQLKEKNLAEDRLPLLTVKIRGLDAFERGLILVFRIEEGEFLNGVRKGSFVEPIFSFRSLQQA